MLNKTTTYENLCAAYKLLRINGESEGKIIGQLALAEEELAEPDSPNDEVVQYIIVRKDLEMSVGKVMAQCCHATKGFMLNGPPYSKIEQEWLNGSHATIVLGVKSETKLFNLVERAKKLEIPLHVVVDEGRTEFNGVPTRTCIALGPARKSVMEPLTKRLRLFETN